MKTKRLTAPKTWQIPRKHGKWVETVKGANPELSLPITVILRDLLKICANKTETKRLLHLGKVLVNKKKVYETSFGVNIFDVITIEGMKSSLRLTLNEKSLLSTIEIPDAEADRKLVKVIGKKILRNGKTQLNFNDGRNMLAGKTNVSVGDSLLISFPEQKILDHLKLEKGALVFITSGSHMGETAKLIDFKAFEGPQQDRVVLADKKLKFETLEDYGFVVGTDKPVIAI